MRVYINWSDLALKILLTNGSGTIAQSLANIAREQFDLGQLEVFGMLLDAADPARYLYDDVVVPGPDYRLEEDTDWEAVFADAGEFDLIVPCTDIEAMKLASLQIENAVVGPEKFHAYGYDKALLSRSLRQAYGDIELVPTFLASEDWRISAQVVSKPRYGGLSIGVNLDDNNPRLLGDIGVVQPFVEGSEYTIATFKGPLSNDVRVMALQRRLRYGMTFYCVRDVEFERKFGLDLAKIIEDLGVVGPANIQGVLASDGKFHIFEINSRLSGTCGIRDGLGFHELRAIIDEWIFKRPSPPFSLVEGGGFRRIVECIVRGPNTEGLELPSDGVTRVMQSIHTRRSCDLPGCTAENARTESRCSSET